MKILCLSDCHLRAEAPRWRIGDYNEQHFAKLKFCFDLAEKNGCEVVAFPGDITHSPRTPYSIISRFIELCIKYPKLKFLMVAGNHDIFHHNNNLDNTPLNVLRSSGVFTLLNDIPLTISGVDFYGASWEEKIPTIINNKNTNILLIHKMIIKEDKLWEGQENYSTARMLLAKNDFDLIVSGDNHQTFFSKYKNKTLLNMGSMCRMTIAQLEHKPSVAIYDTDTKTFETFEIPIRPIEEVFNLEEVEKEKSYREVNTQIKDYVDILGGDVEAKKWNFVGNLNTYIEKNDVSDSVKSIIKSTLEV